MRKVRAIRRMALAERWSRERVLRVSGVPSEPGRLGVQPADVEQPVVVVPHQEDFPEPPRVTRGFRIGVGDLREHGYGCVAVRWDGSRGRHGAFGGMS